MNNNKQCWKARKPVLTGLLAVICVAVVVAAVKFFS